MVKRKDSRLLGVELESPAGVSGEGDKSSEKARYLI